MNLAKRMMAAFVSVCVMLGSVNITAFAAEPPAKNYKTVADASTAQNYESMLGTDVDGNRYAGRVWADKSVYTEKSVDVDGTGTETAVQNDDDFMVVYSAIGSSTSVSTETVTQSNLDVVLIVDMSSSMSTSRLTAVTNAANGLMNNVLAADNNRVAMVTYHNSASTFLDLAHYDHVQGQSNILSLSGYTITARTTSGDYSVTRGRGTNLQAGIAQGMGILADQKAEDVKGRTPVVIVLTDGVTNYAVTKEWWRYSQNNTVQPNSGSISAAIALSTLMNASYMKSAINKTYERDTKVYGISVDLSSTSSAYVVMNPAEVFKAGSEKSIVATAWSNWQTWMNSDDTVTFRENNRNWPFAQLPTNDTNTYGVTKNEVIQNINYVDTHYNAGSEQLEEIFEEIYTEINSPAFNPITDTVVAGGYEEAVPFTYVDLIGEYMEVKEFKQVSLFGKTYQVTESTTTAPYVHDNVNADGTLTRTTTTTYNVGVGADRITHPVFKSNFYISDCVTIELIDECQGYLDPTNKFVKTGVSQQAVWVYITEDALPIILSEVDVNITEGITTTLYKETDEKPIRLYYTVGISNDVKDAGTDHVNLSLVDAEYVAKNTVTLESGEKQVQFYSNRYGTKNTVDAAGNLIGDAHVSFTASEKNRYYYHQNNYPIFSSLTDPATGKTPVIDESEWGVLYHEHDKTQPYKLTWMTYQKAVDSQNDTETEVFTVVGFYREDASTLNTTDGDDVAYMAYSTWQELRFSTVFAYVENADEIGTDDPNGGNAKPVYLNWENGQIVESTTAGYAVTEDSAERAKYIEAVKSYVNSTAKKADGWTLDHVYAYLAIGSERVTRLHNMTMDKVAGTTEKANITGTANIAYAPTYNDNVDHVGGIVIWLGNNGLLRVTPDEPPTSLQISKTATDANTESTFTFAVKDATNTALAATYDAVLTDSTGETPTSVKFTDGTATVELKHGQTILIEELPIGDTFTVEETGKGKYNLQSVTANGQQLAAGTEVATVTLVAGHTATVDFVNEPKQYGNLSIVKEINHNLGTNYAIPADLKFNIQVDLGADAANQTFTYAKTAEAGTETKKADGNGILTFELTNGQEIVIYGLEEGTIAKVTEPSPGTGFKATYWLNGTKVTGTEATATIAANQTQVVVVENSYDPTYTEISPSILVEGTKTTDRKGDWEKEFTIVLEKLVNKTWVELATQTVTQSSPTFNGSVNGAINKALNNEKYSKPGTYSYRVREDNYGQTIDGWTYDATLHTFDVVVVDSDMKGTLAVSEVKCTHTGTNHFAQTENIWANDDLDFYNTFDAKGTSVTLHLDKEITNVAKSSLATVEGFQFGLYDGTEALKYHSELTDASGEALIQIPYHYNNEQRYPYEETYTLKEIVPDSKKAGYAYDEKTYEVVITLSLVDGNVVATYTVGGQSNKATAENPVTFTNTYAPTGTWQFAAEKTLTGRNLALQADEFEFQMDWIYYRESAATEPVAKTEDTPLTAKNAADGTITFDTITFKEVGLYFYEVKELAGTKGGITYDNKKYTVRVEVKDNNGSLAANAIVLDDIDNQIVFANTYAPTPVTVELKATKTLTGRSIPLMDREFVFGLVDANPDGTRVENAVPVYASNINGEVVFTKTYDKAGTYYYRMRETSTSGNGITADETRYVYKVEVTDNNEGILNYTVSFRNENTQEWTPVGAATVGAGFKNTYKASGSVTIQGMKQLIGKDLEAEKFSFGLHEATVGAQGIIVGELVASASNGADGLFSFTIPYGTEQNPLTFDERETSKRYTYVVHEKQETVYDYITYDETQYLVEVTVTDNGDGTVTAVPKITIQGGSEEYSGAAFYNVYNAPEIEVEKTQAVGPNATYAASQTEKVSVKADDMVTYFITITNSGEGYAKNVVIKDEIPEGLILAADSISDGGTVKDGVITWKLDKVAAATRVSAEELIPTVKTVSFCVTVPEVEESTEWKNVASVTYNEPGDKEDTPPTEQETNEVVIEENLPKVSVVKTQKIGDGTATTEKQLVKAGDKVTYQITVSNSGKEAAADLKIMDKLPVGLTLEEGSITHEGVLADGILTWTVETLGAGESITVSFTMTVPKVEKDTAWSNVATVAYENDTDDEDETSNEVIVEEKEVKQSPQTGDTSNVMMWSTFAFASLMICGVILLNEREKRMQE